MKQERRRLGGWRRSILMVGLVSLVMVMAIPAQAGLGDLLDDLLDPIGDVPIVGDIVDPIVEDIVDPIVEDIVDPVAGDLLDPIVDDILAPVVTPIIDEIVTPIVEEVVVPVVNNVVPPVIPPLVPPEVPPVLPTTTTAPPPVSPYHEALAGESGGFGPSTGDPGGVLISNSSAAGPPQAASELASLEAALALQAALVDNSAPGVAISGAAHATEVMAVDSGWLNGLTNWLRNSTDGLLDLLGLPIRLLELLARALLTAGSGLIAPLSMLLAFTAYLIKDRRWSRAEA